METGMKYGFLKHNRDSSAGKDTDRWLGAGILSQSI
jgi:hypothetical protein